MFGAGQVDREAKFKIAAPTVSYSAGAYLANQPAETTLSDPFRDCKEPF